MAATAATAGGALAQQAHSVPAGAGAASGSAGSGGSGTGANGASVARGVPVAAVQRALGVPADGVYGPRTRAAVRRFQRRHGLVPDGIVGPRTLAALGLRRKGRTAGDGSDTKAWLAATLERIAQCESGGDPTAVSADGRYRGKYQFDRGTWRRMGGTGDPAQASEAEQDRVAAKLLAARGTSPWPACG